MHSISTSTSLGSCLTATQLRAGLWVNHLAYSSFMDYKNRISHSHLGTKQSGSRVRSETYGKVGHVGDEDINLDNLLNRRAGLLQDGLQVLDAGGGLLLDRTFDEIALYVTGDLAGAVDGGLSLDGLGLFWR